MTAFGDLCIAVTPRGGAVGPFLGQPVVYCWPWYWHLWRLGPWLLLALALGVPKRNRDRRALLIFVPLAILNLLWPVVAPRVSLFSDSRSMDQFALLFESLVVSLAILWLQVDKLSGYHGLLRVPVSLGILLLGGLATFLSSSRVISDPLFVILLIYMIVMGAILLAALALTRRVTQRRSAPLAFLLWLAVWSLLLMAVSTALVAMVTQSATSRGTIDPRFLFHATLIGGTLGLCLYAVNLPYLLLMFTSPFFRRRFHVWLAAGSVLPPAEAANPEGLCSSGE